MTRVRPAASAHQRGARPARLCEGFEGCVGKRSRGSLALGHPSGSRQQPFRVTGSGLLGSYGNAGVWAGQGGHRGRRGRLRLLLLPQTFTNEEVPPRNSRQSPASCAECPGGPPAGWRDHAAWRSAPFQPWCPLRLPPPTREARGARVKAGQALPQHLEALCGTPCPSISPLLGALCPALPAQFSE